MKLFDIVILAPSVIWLVLAFVWHASGEPIRGLLCFVLFYLTVIFWQGHRMLNAGKSAGTE